MAINNYQAIPSDIHQAEGGGRDSDSDDRPRAWLSSQVVIKWIYFFLGCAILLPFNALTNGVPFFMSRLVGSPFYPTFSSYLTSVYTLTKLFGIVYCTVTSKQSSPARRVIASNTATTLLITSVFLSTFVQGTPSAFFSFALFNAASLAITSSYLCAAVFAEAAVFGPSYLQIVLLGQGAIAAVISAVQVVGAAISVWGLSRESTGIIPLTTTDDKDYQVEGMSARIFLGASALFLVMTLVLYVWLEGQPFYKSFTSVAKQHGESEDTDELTGLVSNDRRRSWTQGTVRAYQHFVQNWDYMFSIAYTFAVTFSIYPAVTVRVQSVDSTIPSVLFTAIHFFVFSAADFIGRQTCSSPSFLAWSPKKIFTLSLTRTLFIPLILLCNVHRSVPPIINSDIIYMFLLFAVGYTNGFIACLAALVVVSPERNPRLERHRGDIDIVGALSGTFIVAGLAAGSLSSFGVVAMV